MVNYNDSFKQLADTIKKINKITNDISATNGIAQIMADSLKINGDRLKELTDNVLRGISSFNINTTNSITSMIEIHNEQMINSFNSFDIAGAQLAASTSAIQKMFQENNSQLNAMLNMTKCSMEINFPTINIFENYHEELTKMLDVIPKAMYTNIIFDKINIQNFNNLALKINDISINEEAFDLNEEDFKNVRDIIITDCSDSSYRLDDLINKLIYYAQSIITADNIKILVFHIVKRLLDGYMVAVFLYYYPPANLIGLLHQQKIEVIQQSSQELINQHTMDELSKYRLVCVTDLNVRSEPAMDAYIKSGLFLGNKVKIVETNGEWARVQWSTTDGELLKGWVKKRYLTAPNVDQPQVE